MSERLDPRLPIIVGTGQLTIREASDDPREPVELMAEALRLAEADAGVTGLLAAADSIRTVNQLSWRYANAPLEVARRIGALPSHMATSVMGGNLAGVMVARAAAEIQDGALDVVLICGGEATRAISHLKADGLRPDWTVQPDDTPPAETIGDERPLASAVESARGVVMPVHVYPLFETALRARLGLSVDEHRARLGALWSAFAAVAVDNPYAAIQSGFTPEQISDATPDNRMISSPYTKRLCSNNQVNQGSGLILTSVAAAERLGISRDRWVFLHAGAEAVDHWNVSNRADLCSSPALRLAGRDAFASAGITSSDVDHADLYSCFPAAVQIGAIELGFIEPNAVPGRGWGGIGARLPLTVTGGMSFAGGPWNDYASHGIATMVGVLRADRGSIGVCTANGGYTTEHAVLVMSTNAPASGGYTHSEPQSEVDALPFVELDDDWIGVVTIEGATVVHDRNGPTHALVAARTPAGNRTWGSSTDPAFMNTIENDEIVGMLALRSSTGVIEPSSTV
jgi:acetyl-CoA C-acetyltransferase